MDIGRDTVKYFNLLRKDINMLRNTIVFILIYFLVMPFFFQNEFCSKDTNIQALSLFIIEVLIVLGICFIYLEDKNKGDELLTTTSITRSMLVKSKYFRMIAFLILALLLSGVSILIMSAMSGSNTIDYYDFKFVFACLFFINSLSISLGMPFTFLLNNVHVKSIILTVIIQFVGMIPMFVDFKKIKYGINPLYIFILGALAVITVSIEVSKRIFAKKDL